MDDRRPDPEKLLEKIRQEEALALSGRLKVFFGAAPGVGKTYAMLEAARLRKAEGVDVAVGLVETHHRRETEALLEGLEIIPLRRVEYRGTVIREFDLDGVIARRPALVLVDELAHSNAPGSRHKKRWQDVFELLDAGISVYTTMNVQHLESLNDVVAQITGVVVRETLPDSVFDRADEIELVDLPPDELLKRLEEGKVYVPELAATARERFFRKGNLIALRELALRRTAERVDAQMETYRRAEGIREVWPAAERILVCVGPNPRSIRLIRAAKRMAAGLRAEWIAAYVEAPSKVRPSGRDRKQLAEHMRLAESLGAETLTLSGARASEEILTYARARNVSRIIVGKPTHPRWKDKLLGSMLDEIVRGSGEIDVYVITGDTPEPMPERAPARGGRAAAPPREWALAAASVAACTSLAALMYPYFELVDLAMVFLLGVVFTASLAEKGPSFLATVMSVLVFDFLFVAPRYTFAVHDVRFLVTFGVMLFVGYATSRLTHRIRAQTRASREREQRTAVLYRLSRELVHERDVEALGAIAVRHIQEVFSCRAVVLVPGGDGALQVSPPGAAPSPLDREETGVAHWVFGHRERAGAGTDTLPGSRGFYLPLLAGPRAVGVLGVFCEEGTDPWDTEKVQALESFATPIAMALERVLLAEEAQAALIKAEREAMRNALLSSVSHDLRTPLAAITGATTTLLQGDASLDRDGRRELLQTVIEEADHLNRIIRNILDMTRLESGAITVRKEWQSLEEIVGAVLDRMGDRLAGRPLDVRLPPDLPFVPFDPLLMEQVFINLLENAVRYTPAGTPLALSARVEGGEVVVELADRGPGIRPGEEERIFEKFVRGGGALEGKARSGVGLGLTICRAIVAAHGGRIRAENREGGGAVFRFTLPLGEKPDLPPDEEPGQEPAQGPKEAP